MENRLSPDSGRRWLHVRVLDTQGRATRPGAEVRVYAAGTDRLLGMRLVDTGSGYDAQSDLPVHFGLGARGRVDVSVTVAGSGERHTGVVENLDLSRFSDSALTIRIDGAGRIVR